MRKTILLVLAFALALAARADDFDLGAHGHVTLTLPKDWHAAGRDLMGQAYDLTITPPGGPNAQLKLTLIYGKDDRLQDKKALSAAFLQVCAQFIPTSVEQKANVKNFTLRQGFGQYASFTDKDLVGKPPVRGNYKVMTSGLIYLGNRVSGAVTLFTDSLTGPEFKPMLGIVESLEYSPPKPAAGK